VLDSNVDVTPLVHRNGIVEVGEAVPVKSYTGVWVDRGQAEQQHVSGVRVDGRVAVTITEERDW
jgi:hypothetical protein